MERLRSAPIGRKSAERSRARSWPLDRLGGTGPDGLKGFAGDLGDENGIVLHPIGKVGPAVLTKQERATGSEDPCPNGPEPMIVLLLATLISLPTGSMAIVAATTMTYGSAEVAYFSRSARVFRVTVLPSRPPYVPFCPMAWTEAKPSVAPARVERMVVGVVGVPVRVAEDHAVGVALGHALDGLLHFVEVAGCRAGEGKPFFDHAVERRVIEVRRRAQPVLFEGLQPVGTRLEGRTDRVGRSFAGVGIHLMSHDRLLFSGKGDVW